MKVKQRFTSFLDKIRMIIELPEVSICLLSLKQKRTKNCNGN